MMKPPTITDLDAPSRLYLDLLKRCLTRYAFGETYRLIASRRGSIKWMLYTPLRKLLNVFQIELVQLVSFDPYLRAYGRDYPLEAETMIGLQRLDSLQRCIADVLRQGVPGDLIETGVWRGGATILMRAVLKIYGETQRVVWVADSFQGVPKPDSSHYPADKGDRHWTKPQLSVSLEQVRANFRRYNLLDEQVRFLPGWFRDTLPTAPIERLAILRLDGDLYESTILALRSLYPRLSIGGYVIIDDYGAVAGCRAAVEDFRTECGVTEEFQHIDWTGVFWQRCK